MTQEEKILLLIKGLIKGTEWENKIYLIGGAVRDQIMGKPVDDLDFVVEGDINSGLEFAEWLCKKWNVYKEGSNPVIFPKYGTANMHYNNIKLEFVAPRKEKYTPGSRKPIVTGGVLMDDAMRRDLTINSLMRNISNDKIVDLTGKGLSDIQKGIIRTPADPEIIFKDDPLRMLRVIRFAVKYGFNFTDGILESIKKRANWITSISQERIREELNKILVSNKPDWGFELLRDTGLLEHIIPELNKAVGMEQNIHHKEDVFGHTMTVLRNTPADLKARLMALFHDIGKVETKTTDSDGSIHFYDHENKSAELTRQIMSRLTYPNDIINDVIVGIENHMALKHGTDDTSKLSDKTLRKFTTKIGGNLDSILDFIHADNISHSDESSMPNQVKMVRQRIKDLNAPVGKTEVKLPISGADVLALGVKQGPMVGKVLDAVKEAWYGNPDLTKDEAIEIVKQFRLDTEITEIKRIIKSIIN